MVLYPDPVDGYRRSTPATASRTITATRTALRCRPVEDRLHPGELLGCVSGALGLRKFFEDGGHELVVTSDKDGPDSEFERELPDADIVISQPFGRPT